MDDLLDNFAGNFGDGDLPNYNRPVNNFGVSGPDQFGLVVTQQVIEYGKRVSIGF